MFGTDPHGHAVEQGGRVAPAGKDGTQQVAHQLRGGGRGRRTLYGADGGQCQTPDRQVFPGILCRADDGGLFQITLQVPGKGTEGIPQEEPHRQPCCVGGNAQHIEVLFRQQGNGTELIFPPQSKRLDGAEEVLFSDAFRRAEEHLHAGLRPEWVGAFCPADHSGGIAVLAQNAAVVLPVCQQHIQHSGIGKGSVFADGGILALFVPVGAEGGSVEGDQSRTGTLRTGHSLDGGMDPLHRGHFAGDEALHQRAVCIAIVVVGLPCLDAGGILGVAEVAAVGVFIGEHQICVVVEGVPLLRQQGMLGSLCRVPVVKKGEKGTDRRAVHPGKNRAVQLCTRLEALHGTVRLTLFVRPQ